MEERQTDTDREKDKNICLHGSVLNLYFEDLRERGMKRKRQIEKRGKYMYVRVFVSNPYSEDLVKRERERQTDRERKRDREREKEIYI